MVKQTNNKNLLLKLGKSVKDKFTKYTSIGCIWGKKHATWKKREIKICIQMELYGVNMRDAPAGENKSKG